MIAFPIKRIESASFLNCKKNNTLRKRKTSTAATAAKREEEEFDYVVIGSGIGGLTVAALLAYHEYSVCVLESHYEPGGCLHGFKREIVGVGEFSFDTGPSFFAGLTEANALNPLASLLKVLGEEIETVKYDPLGTFHIERGVPGLRRHADLEVLTNEIERFSKDGAREVASAVPEIRKMFEALSGLPTIALRTDWRMLIVIGKRYLEKLGKLGAYGNVLGKPTTSLLEFLDIKDPWVRFLCDLECFLLSGMDASGTVSAEFASVFGASDRFKHSEFPIRGAKTISDALVRAIEKRGGKIRVNAHVKNIELNEKNDQAVGVKMQKDDRIIRAKKGVISNASVWDTYEKLIPKTATNVSEKDYKKNTSIECSDSFMHAHLGIRADNLDFSHLGGHHVVVNDKSKPLDSPGNVVMISIASVWSPEMAPAGYHCIHCYTMEPFDNWKELKANDKEAYEQKKREKCNVLFTALETVIPDVRDRVVLELLASPASHEKWLRRHRGTYGAIIKAPKLFPGASVKGISRLHRVGDSVAPGVGVPAAAASGVICANTLLSLEEHFAFLDLCAER